MNTADDHLERLISRKLDGELSADESLELDKHLIRDPSAQQLFEESERIDELARVFLGEVCAESEERVHVAASAQEPTRRRRWIGVVPAIAAACLALFIAWPMFSPTEPEQDTIVDGGPLPGARPEAPPATVPNEVPDVLSRPALARSDDRFGGLRPLRETGTRLDYYGVLDEKTNELFLLEVRHQTTAQRRGRFDRRGLSGSGVRLASSEM